MHKKKIIISSMLLIMMLFTGLNDSYATMTHRLKRSSLTTQPLFYCSIYAGHWNKTQQACARLTFRKTILLVFGRSWRETDGWITLDEDFKAFLKGQQNCFKLNFSTSHGKYGYSSYKSDHILATNNHLSPEEFIISY
jgi:hypothetical protein